MSFLYNFVSEFLDRYLRSIFTDKEKTPDNYKWLLSRVDIVQSYLGLGGLAEYKPPYENFVIHNYRVITEVINQLGTTIPPHKDDLITVRNLLYRYIKNLEVLIVLFV